MNSLTKISQEIQTLPGSLDKDSFIQTIDAKVTETIQNSKNIPGLQAEEFQSIRGGVIERWNELLKKGVLEVTGTDKEVRPYFVALQGIVEHVLSQELGKSISSLKGVIHTPMPATPLCTKGNISKDLLSPSIEKDPQSRFTVEARTTIIRNYLVQGGHLHIAYPKDGINKRSEAQQQIYKEELNRYSSNQKIQTGYLFDCPLECDSIDTAMIGAFYLFKSKQESKTEKVFAFAIKMTQANDPKDLGSFGLWFGPLEQSPVQERISSVLNNVLKFAPKAIDLSM